VHAPCTHLQVHDAAVWVLDEAHHLRGSHPYARLMHFVAHAPEHARPRVVGLTATPVRGRAAGAKGGGTEGTAHAI